MNTLNRILLFLSLVILTTCENGSTEPEPATCLDGMKNQDETGIDCGGSKCVECFDCFSDFCVFLSGSTFPGEGTSKRWKCTIYEGQAINEVNCDGDLGCEIYKSMRLKFTNKGSAEFTGNDGGPVNGKWEFNDPKNPGLITITFNETHPSYGDEELLPFSSLNENELVITSFGKVGTFEPY